MKKSNLYAERIFSEHPLAMWSFDDDVSFFQTLSSSQQDISDWSTSNVDSISYVLGEVSPISNSNTFEIECSGTPDFVVSLTSPFSVNSLDDFNQEKTTGCFSTHIFSNGNVTNYEIGVSIDSVEYTTGYHNSGSGWRHISHTFDIPEVDKEIYLIIKITVSSPSESIKVNGLSLGQWSEEYNYKSIGFNEIDLPSSIEPLIEGGSEYSAVYADSYGINLDDNGYFLVKNKSAYCRPAGISLIYGSSQSVSILNNQDSNPSIIMPGKGFLNESGINNNYTLEAWVRLSNLSFDPIRIIGPLSSTDGIYVEEGFISIYVGPYTSSYYVGKWNRPMLIHFEYSPQLCTLYVNGEKAISLEIDINNISFANKWNDGIDQDWIGIYGSQYVTPFEIDCVSIYPYLVPQETAKKHFVYGQGVQEYEFSSQDIFKKTIEIDFPYSEYAFNVIYPDTNKWRSGFSVNMNATSSYLSSANHNLPEIIVKNDIEFLNENDWYLENRRINNDNPDIVPYIKMLPIDQYTECSIYFNNLNILSEKVYAVFGTFKAPSSSTSNQEIFSFVNKNTGEIFKVYLDNNTLNYSFINQLGEESILKQEQVDNNDFFNAGIDLSYIGTEFYSIVGSFFSVLDKLSLNVGGTSDNIFLGNIYGIHFDNKYLFEKDIKNNFTNSFMNKNAGLLTFIEYIGSYSLLPVFKNVTMSFDIGSSGYWEDIIPMSMFGKNIVNASGVSTYDLDTIQFNINAPYEQVFSTEQTPDFPYSVLYSLLNLYDKDYDYVNSLGYTSYQDITDSYYSAYNQIRVDTGLKSYVTMQDSEDAGNLLYSSFENIVSASANRVIELSSASATKYEIFDNYVIVPPGDEDFRSKYLGIHLEMKVRGTLTKNMIIKNMQLSSFVFDYNDIGTIGTKYSYPIFAKVDQ